MRGLVAAAMLVAGCTSIGGGSGDDGADDAAPEPTLDGAPGAIDGTPGEDPLGSANNPAASCAELRDADAASGVYWIRHPSLEDVALELYCEQELGGGGWALLYNSVMTEGETTAFFQIVYADRFEEKGDPHPAENYYHGALYLLGTQYLDVITDLADTTVVAARVDAQGVNEESMAFQLPTLIAGNGSIFGSHYSGGWSSSDRDGDPYESNCAAVYCNVSQHYSSCWSYNLGCDVGGDDGGVGPHVNDGVLTAIGLAVQPDSGDYSRVKRITRFTRW